MTRYYKATDGTFTVYRTTVRHDYLSAWIRHDRRAIRVADAWVPGDEIYPAFGFTAKPGPIKAVEITKAEYDRDHRANIGWVANADLVDPAVKAKTLREVEAKAAANIRAIMMKEPEVFEEAAAPVVAVDPTKTTYISLVLAYDYLNERLWSGKLPQCLVTLQRKANCRGYFAGARFVTRDGKTITDEIALNPSTFKERDTRSILSTLAHEMCHLEQHHFGRPGKGGYHNKEWAELMLAIGLKPISIDQPGKQVGNKVTHEIVPGGHFDGIVDALIENGAVIDYVEAWTEEGKAKASKKLKVKYSCPQCGVNCWAKPDSHFVCGDCDEAMEADI